MRIGVRKGKWIALFLLACGGARLHAAGDRIDIAAAILSKNGEAIRIVFSQNLAPGGAEFKSGGATLKGGSGDIGIVSIAPISLETNALLLTLSGPIASDGVTICFPKVDWIDDHKKPASGNPPCVPLSRDYATAKAAALADLTGVPKSSSEKSVFASGFVATAAGASQGGGTISLNPAIGIPGMTSFLNIDKTTVAKGDPKVFNAGVSYQSVLPWGRSGVTAMANATTPEDLADALRKQQQRVFAGAVLDVRAKLEADPGTFKVTNIVGEVDLTLRSRTKRIGSKGYWRGYVLPFGFEGGQNVAAADLVLPTSSSVSPPSSARTIASVNNVARYLAGVNFNAFYENWDGQLPFKRIEFEANALGRYLFFKEAMYNTSSKLFNTVGDGIRGYGNVDMKLFLGQSDSARYGLKLTYAVGSLPPVFARVKTFQVGLIYETKDDKTKGKIKEKI